MAAREVAAYAEAHPCEIFGAQQLGDVFQPVVAAGASPLTDAQRAERQGDVIGYDQQVLARNLLRVEPVAHRLAREVHVGRGFQQHQRAALVPDFSHVAVAGGGKKRVGRPGQGVQHFESDVVAGLGVFGADVAQPNDEVFHAASAIICLRQRRHRAKHGLRARRRRPSWRGSRT